MVAREHFLCGTFFTALGRSVLQGSRLCFCFACELLEREPLSHDSLDCFIEPLRISHLRVVETIRLFVQVTEQIEWFGRNVGSVNFALEQRPEALPAVRANLPIHVPDSVIDDFMLKFIQPFV
jgi:hypothetical protein